MNGRTMKTGPMKRLAATVLICAAALAGCSPPPVPDVTYFRLPAPAALPHADKPMSLLPIEVDVFDAEGVYSEQSLIYTVTPDTLRTYHYQLWSDPPTHALQVRLVGMLRESGIAELVTDRLPASTQALRVHGTIRRYERSGNGGAFTVFVAVTMRVEHDSGEPLIEQDYHAEVPAADATLDATVKAFGTAIDQVFARFYADLVALQGDPHA
jgi:cholesterol transport system auxiliary component